MLTLYCRRQGQIVADRIHPSSALPDGLVWADLLEPTPEEKALIKSIAGIEVPTPEEMREIEPSSRLYREGLALFMTASVLNRTDTPDPETRAIAFVLTEGLMVTIRYVTPMPWQTYQARIKTQPELCSSPEVALVELLDAIVDRVADTLESVDVHVNQLSKAIFSPLDGKKAANRDFTQELQSIGLNAIRCSKVDESLVGLSRLLTFLDMNLRQAGQKQVRPRIKDLQRDIVSLLGYEERLSEKLQFILEATLGMINTQQNGIIKIFSVVAVVFLPPTLIASIYGMNFEFMPELQWPFGYPFSLGLMVLSAILPYVVFKRRGWL
jgi:magnesium transporter